MNLIGPFSASLFVASLSYAQEVMNLIITERTIRVPFFLNTTTVLHAMTFFLITKTLEADTEIGEIEVVYENALKLNFPLWVKPSFMLARA